jgi:general secretion pathway protein D
MKKISLFVFVVLMFTSLMPAQQKQFTLNFSNIDILTFIRLVSEFTGENFVIDPNVRGTVTIFSQKPVDSEKLPQVFQAVLNLYGYAVVKRDGISFIIPATDARSRSQYVNFGEISEDKNDVFITQVIPLRYYPAETVSQILTPYFSKNGQLSLDSRSNTLFVSDFGITIRKVLEIIKVIDQPSPPGKETLRVYKLQNANSEEIAKILTDVLSKKRPTGPVRPGPQQAISPMVVAVKATNSIIIYSDPDDYSGIENLIQQLDVMTKQVLIEALIAEVTYSADKDVGIQWQDANTFKQGQYVGSVETNFGITSTTGGISSGLKIAIVRGDTIVGGIGATIALFGQDTKFNILSTPQIMTADNQEAEINVSENTPFLKETRFVSGTTTTASDTIKSYDYKDVGIILKITPQISEDKYVRLKIHQEVTKVLSNIDGALTTAKRQVDTTLIVPNSKTIVLGGLIKNEGDSTIQKVPGLGDIKFLGIGNLFRRKSQSSVKTNLLIFITPHIVTSFEEAEKIKIDKEKLLPHDDRK